jgi:hypothetical protein
MILSQVGEHHAHSGIEECDGDAQSDSAAASGDECGFSGCIHIAHGLDRSGCPDRHPRTSPRVDHAMGIARSTLTTG